MAAIRWPLTVRRIHKWLALVVGLQVLLWTVTGFYMVVVHIDTIHGDHLVKAAPVPTMATAGLIPPGRIAAAAPGTIEVRLQQRLGVPIWRVQSQDGLAAFDARTGSRLDELNEADVRQIAASLYSGNAAIIRATRLTAPVQELGKRKPPYWQVEFAGWNRPTLYIAPLTGELIARRHRLWRIFDFAWMLHIMDYDARTDVNNPLLRVATWSAFAMAISGAWLLIWTFPRRKKKKARA
ncbi:PepSY domain-containing protein [Sphingomonas hankookensis]|uniref:PepSY domain-containing protein n=1 Tax=Sphingomonas hankookensis TaxID=563996 RepID=UPI0026C975C5